MFDGVLQNELLRCAAERLGPARAVRLGGVWGSAAPLIAAALGRLRDELVLFITGHLDDADEVADDIEVLTGQAAHLFPAWEVDVGTDHLNEEITAERLKICNLLTQPADQRDEQLRCIVAPIMSLLQPVPTPQVLARGRLTLRKGGTMDLERFVAWLVDAGYEQVDQVDLQGQFARRGGIVDVFVPGQYQALRVEFFGETVESIRRFDLDTQRSTDEVEHFDLTSITSIQGTDPSDTTQLLSYLRDESIVCIVEPAEVAELGGQLYERAEELAGRLATPLVRFTAEQILDSATRLSQVQMHRFSPSGPDVIQMGIRSLERLSINTREALDELEQISDVADVWVYCQNPAERDRFFQVLNATHPKLAGRVRVGIGHLHCGFYWPGQKLATVGHHEIYRRYARVRRIRRIRAGRPIDSLLDLQVGDYVVHVSHGIARFDGLCQIERDGTKQEYLTLRFAEGKQLHVPASRIDLVQKYIGAGRRRPSLSRLGGTGWLRQKKRVSVAVRDMAAEMLRIQAVREAMKGQSYPATSDWQRQFAEEFIYSETEDQIAAMQQIDADMSSQRPMDRLLCGDVGYGKTELAMRAAFRVAEAGKQVAVLVPTTVLAAQHYRTFSERFADYPFHIEMLSRFRTAAQQAQIVRRLAMGQVDIVIGTHRLLSRDVRFADLGLVIIDEEQRFGVQHKEHLKSLRATVEVLTMTATPIPRTLHMALLGLRDISALATPPLDRRAIYTEVCHYDDDLIRMAILRELNRGGQVFFVHNRVRTIESVAEHVRSLVPEAKVRFAHGRMPEGRLEKVMLDFVRRRFDVLVCTTIIESGLDIPTANTMIIHEADRFGLAELHQLRGRVGRYKHRAYCYLLLPETRPVRRDAARRLKAIEEFSDLGAGFQIAMRDLEIRGAGNILGRQQSGHIAAVGYELYCQLLQRAVSELRGREVPTRRHVHVDLGLDLYIPKSYVTSDRQRMEIYRRLAGCHTVDQLEQLRRDLDDVYGPIPPAVGSLLDMAEVRILAGRMGIDSIILMAPDVIFSVSDFSTAQSLFEDAPGSVRLPDDRTVYWRPPKAYLEMPTLVNVLLKRLRAAAPVL